MKRWIFNILCGISLLLSMAAAGMWWRSCWPETDRLVLGTVGERRYEVVSMRGDVLLIAVTKLTGSPRKSVIHGWWGHLGVGYLDSTYRLERQAMVLVPYWYPVLVFAMPPLGWVASRIVRRRRISRRRASNRCVKCGYDLRATPQRCPECGELARQERA